MGTGAELVGGGGSRGADAGGEGAKPKPKQAQQPPPPKSARLEPASSGNIANRACKVSPGRSAVKPDTQASRDPPTGPTSGGGLSRRRAFEVGTRSDVSSTPGGLL
jgi:hypothetical protein